MSWFLLGFAETAPIDPDLDDRCDMLIKNGNSHSDGIAYVRHAERSI